MTKSIFLQAALCLIILSSCSVSQNTFMRQRYTNYRHSKSHPVAHQPKERVTSHKETEVTASGLYVAPVPVKTSKKQADNQTLLANNATKSNKVRSAMKMLRSGVVPIVVKPIKDLSSRLPSTSFSKAQQITKDNKVEKRGLLFGVIDAILAIVIAVLFVALIIFLVLLLV